MPLDGITSIFEGIVVGTEIDMWRVMGGAMMEGDVHHAEAELCKSIQY